MRSLQFKTPKHEAMECETLVRNIHNKNQDGVCHVTKNKHGDECMQNLKQKETSIVQKGLGALSICFLKQKLLCMLPRKEMHFLFKLFLQ